MRVQYTRNALDDLAGIIAYLASRTPHGGEKVRADIRTTVDRLVKHPFSGREQDEDAVRRIVTPGYRYLIDYHVDQEADLVSILAILHSAREQPFRSA